MKKKKLKLLYNANGLAPGLEKTSFRAGIYFCFLNILKQMAKRDDFEISLSVMPKEKNKVKKVISKEFPDKKFKFVTLQDIPQREVIDTLVYLCFSDRCFCVKYIQKIVIYLHYFLYRLFFGIYCFILSFNNYDAYFTASLSSFPKRLRVKTKYTLLHDTTAFLFPSYFPAFFIEKHNRLIATLNENDYYFTDSENSRKDFLKFVPVIDPNKITNTYIGCHVVNSVKEGDKERVKKKYNIPVDKKYLFSLCTLQQRKNLVRNIKTFIQFIEKHNIDDLVFVMGGGFWEHFMSKFKSSLSGVNTDKIIKIGYVDDEDLPALYSGAEWFTYTSQYEGFGLPVLEAMNCGCPVITSNNSSLPEVIGDAGIQIDWDSDEQHVEAYEKYYFNEELRRENSKKGMERAKLFTWEKAVNKMTDIMLKNADIS